MVKNTSNSNIRALILDMDGVIWRGDEAIGDLPAIFTRIGEASLGVVFVTNNSTRTVPDFLTKLSSLGIQVESWQVITSAEATASYLAGCIPPGSRVFAVGESGLQATLQSHGFLLSEQEAKAVIVGLDRDFSYPKLATAMKLVEQGAILVGTNPDLTLPQPGGAIPGAGAIIAAVEAAAGIKSRIIGKPNPDMFRQALERLNLPAANTLVVGDRLDTDIAGGQNSGCKTAVVLSGACTEDQAVAWRPRPDFIENDLDELINQVT